MKQLKLFFALFAMLALGVGNAWGAVYFEDNFSDVGNKDNQSISTRTGWETFSKCYSQGNSGLRIGSSSAAGNITKSKISDISGTKDIKVTVYVARYNTNANKFTVTTTNGTISSVSGVGTLSNGTLTISPTGNAGVTSTTSQAKWTDTYKTEFIITGASASTTIKFASNKRVILGPITIEDASSTDEPGSEETVVSLIPKNGCLLGGKFTYFFTVNFDLFSLSVANVSPLYVRIPIDYQSITSCHIQPLPTYPPVWRVPASSGW